MGSVRGSVILVLLLGLGLKWTWMPLASAQAVEERARRDVRHTSGLAVGLGIGAPNGLVGGQLDYFIDWGHPKLRLGAFAGLGYLGSAGDTPPENVGFVAGAFGSFGRRTHRLYFDLYARRGGFIDSGNEASWRRYWAILGGAGYEIVTRRGFLARVAVGVGPAILRGTFWGPLQRLAIDGQLTLGCKLW